MPATDQFPMRDSAVSDSSTTDRVMRKFRSICFTAFMEISVKA